MADEIAKYKIINILSDHIHGVRSSDIEELQELYKIAKKHQVLPITYYQTKDTQLYPSYIQAISIYTHRKALLAQIESVLTDIPFYTVKGISVSKYYPIPQLRTMGDCDIIVRDCDKEKAKEILLSTGFENHTGKTVEMEWHLSKQGLDFELHHRLLYDEAINTEREKAFADTAWDYVQNHELDADFHFVYLLLHLKKHLLIRGVGIRQFMDLAVMSMNGDLNRNRVVSFLNQAGIERFAGICSALCLRWFGISLPVETPDISDEFYIRTTENILASGVFGFELSDNEKKGFLNDVKRNGKMRSLVWRFFPSYRLCCTIPKYRWIKGKPLLLPALWIYRLFWALMSRKSKSSVKDIMAIVNSDVAVTEWTQELKKWGL